MGIEFVFSNNNWLKMHHKPMRRKPYKRLNPICFDERYILGSRVSGFPEENVQQRLRMEYLRRVIKRPVVVDPNGEYKNICDATGVDYIREVT
ncbi:MAG: hypothetical protein IJX85_12415 [Lachnospiraceae bacterium]|nr:hypothetical protein [Lachnospiraceae bacterium]